MSTLFDGLNPDPPAQRHSATSIAAADGIRVTANTLRAEVYRVICEAGATGATDEEMQLALGMGGNTQRPRRRECEKGGFIRDSGKTRLTSSGRAAVVWVKT